MDNLVFPSVVETHCFFECSFSSDKNPETLLIDEVEVGKRYEVVLTTESGFYRYRVGDVVEVVDFHHNCPVVQVKYRYEYSDHCRPSDLLVVNSIRLDSIQF